MAQASQRLCPRCGASVNVTHQSDGLTFFTCPECATAGADSAQTVEEIATAPRKRLHQRNTRRSHVTDSWNCSLCRDAPTPTKQTRRTSSWQNNHRGGNVTAEQVHMGAAAYARAEILRLRVLRGDLRNN